MLKNVSGPRKKKDKKRWTKLQNEELRTPSFLPNITAVIISRCVMRDVCITKEVHTNQTAGNKGERPFGRMGHNDIKKTLEKSTSVGFIWLRTRCNGRRL
jgi:hypothetical protein